MKKKLLFLLSVVLVFSLASFGLIAVSQKQDMEAKEDTKHIVTSFYPVYILTKNLTQGTEGILVKNLTENHAGCLHDYTLTTKDMKLLEQADLVVLNGGGMESFLEELLHEKEAHWNVVDASEGLMLLDGVSHMHGEETGVHEGESKQTDGEVVDAHEEELEQIDGEIADVHKGEIEHSHGEKNAHVWMNVDQYGKQVDTICEALKVFDPAQKQIYEKNAMQYKEKLMKVQEKKSELLYYTSGMEVIIFHDAFAYFSQMLNMEVIHSLSLDEDTALSAGELAEVIEEVKLHQIPYLFVEEAYVQTAEIVAAETGAEVVCLNPMTQGEDVLTAYVDMMLENLYILEEKLKK